VQPAGSGAERGAPASCLQASAAGVAEAAADGRSSAGPGAVPGAVAAEGLGATGAAEQASLPASTGARPSAAGGSDEDEQAGLGCNSTAEQGHLLSW